MQNEKSRMSIRCQFQTCINKKVGLNYPLHSQYLQSSHPGRLTAEISYGIHALRSIEQPHVLGGSNLDSTPHQSSELPDVFAETGDKMPQSTEPLLLVNPLEGDSLVWPNITDADMACSYTLGKLTLETQTVVELFQQYVIFLSRGIFFWLTEPYSFGTHYHPHAIFLQLCPSLSDLLTRSPLLFWTIILIASQDITRFAAIYQQVVAEHEGLLSPILHRAIQQIETIHALLLLCLWPIPQSRHFHNPAWNYVGLSISAAMQLSCHMPLSATKTEGWRGLGHVTANELSIADQARTWLGCFWVGTA